MLNLTRDLDLIKIFYAQLDDFGWTLVRRTMGTYAGYGLSGRDITIVHCFFLGFKASWWLRI